MCANSLGSILCGCKILNTIEIHLGYTITPKLVTRPTKDLPLTSIKQQQTKKHFIFTFMKI